MNPDIRFAVLVLLRAGQSIKAMRLVRERTGCSLQDAKTQVEQVIDEMFPKDGAK